MCDFLNEMAIMMSQNKSNGSISVSMSIYQNLICFVCTHLSSAEKEDEAVKRNSDVQYIVEPKRIIWLGDLNYRINLSYDETQQLVSTRDWSDLVEYDQVKIIKCLVENIVVDRSFNQLPDTGAVLISFCIYTLESFIRMLREVEESTNLISSRVTSDS